MVKEGFHSAEGLYRTLEEAGLAYDTPEAISIDCHYRAPSYMRPLSIWSMYRAYTMWKGDETKSTGAQVVNCDNMINGDK